MRNRTAALTTILNRFGSAFTHTEQREIRRHLRHGAPLSTGLQERIRQLADGLEEAALARRPQR